MDSSSLQLYNLKNLLGLKRLKRIEGFDISNISGKYSVASMVVFENGAPFAVIEFGLYESVVTVMEIIVAPEKRGQGMGSKAIKELLENSKTIIGIDIEKAKQAIAIIDLIANDPEIGAIYNGVVTRLMSFGAFVEIAPGKEGLVHISKLDVKRTEKVEDCVNVGDEVIVKVTEIDDQGRINLSRRDALIEIEGLTPEDDGEEAPRRPRPRRDNDRRGGRR